VNVVICCGVRAACGGGGKVRGRGVLAVVQAVSLNGPLKVTAGQHGGATLFLQVHTHPILVLLQWLKS
jgi:hypothetical protein